MLNYEPLAINQLLLFTEQRLMLDSSSQISLIRLRLLY